jgi:hypothetical protein
MRNTKAQRRNIMIRVSASQQPSKSHVSHAETGGSWKPAGYDGQRCALLTTKSRNTCTRATDFNSSG